MSDGQIRRTDALPWLSVWLSRLGTLGDLPPPASHGDHHVPEDGGWAEGRGTSAGTRLAATRSDRGL